MVKTCIFICSHCGREVQELVCVVRKRQEKSLGGQLFCGVRCCGQSKARPSPAVNCGYCKTPISSTRRIRSGLQRSLSGLLFCSNICSNYHRSGSSKPSRKYKVYCGYCHGLFLMVRKSLSWRMGKSKSGYLFCSISCSSSYLWWKRNWAQEQKMLGELKIAMANGK